MKIILIYLILILTIISCNSSLTETAETPLNKYDASIDSLLVIMTINEKAGQLNVLNYGEDLINPSGEEVDVEKAIQEGLVGGIQNIRGVDFLTKLQKIAVEKSRLGIPLLFPADIIHGTEVVFPIPLALASSWDLEAVKQVSQIAAIEAAAQGINLTYSPMVDLTRDPRWGRVMEGSGEDHFLGARIAEATVKGYQGNNLSSPATIGACVKHLAAYGAVEAGRDYNVVDMSERRLREEYLPGYKAAFDAGAVSAMVSFNEINGVPSSSNDYLLHHILRDEWKFEGFVIGDYTSVGELVYHGVARDLKHAAELAVNAGVDIDMASISFLKYLPELVEEGKVSMQVVDDAVRHVLRVKYALGIMDNPFLYLDKKREKEQVFKPEYLKVAREAAQKSIVLLKNKNQLLPIQKDLKKIALIGPFADDKITPMGGWTFGGSHYESIVSLLDGIKSKVSDNTQILYAKGCNANDDSMADILEAKNIAKQADVVVVALGEPIEMIGETTSRTELNIPGKQIELLKELNKTGKPIVVLLFSGRPLLLEWLEKHIPSIVQVWHLGHESGHAIADVLFGDYNPSAKLTMSFPYAVGQIPIYYNNRTTGRPYQKGYRWCSRYLDNSNEPLYPFGYGLSYTTFKYSDISLDHSKLAVNDTITATVKIKNTGNFDGVEVVQLYIQDLVGSITRPKKELKGFKRIKLKANEEKEVSFKVSVDELKFYNKDLELTAEHGNFKIYIGTSSVNTKEIAFEYIE